MNFKVNGKIIEKVENPVFKRDVVKLEFEHFKTNTPNRHQIIEESAKILKVNPEFLMLQKISTVYGSAKCIAKLHVYKNRKDLEANEPAYLLKRVEKKEEPKKEEAPTPTPEAPKPAEEKKEEVKTEEKQKEGDVKKEGE